MANKFELSGGGIQIEYTLGGNPTFPSLTFLKVRPKRRSPPQRSPPTRAGSALWCRWR
jgi:hypothetical protein